MAIITNMEDNLERILLIKLHNRLPIVDVRESRVANIEDHSKQQENGDVRLTHDIATWKL